MRVSGQYGRQRREYFRRPGSNLISANPGAGNRRISAPGDIKVNWGILIPVFIVAGIGIWAIRTEQNR